MKRVLMILFAMVLVAGFANAQSTAASSITVGVGADLVVAEGSAGDFGEVAGGVIYTVAPSGDKVPPGPGNGGAAEVVTPVQWTIDGQGDAAVKITLLLTDRLIGDGGGLIPVSYTSQSGGWNSLGDPAATMDLFDPRIGTTVYLDDAGHADVYLGAVLSVPTGAPTGTYTSSVALNASYTGF